MSAPEAALRVAEHVAQLLEERGVSCVVIGAVAMAAHHYVRYTEDIDLGTIADLETLRSVGDALRATGYEAELREPDAQDPLGGVLDVSGQFGLVQVISFADRFPAVIRDATRDSVLLARPGSALRLAPIPYLVALKLYAGGYKSKADIVELLRRNPEANLEEIRELCARYRLSGLEELLGELR